MAYRWIPCKLAAATTPHSRFLLLVSVSIPLSSRSVFAVAMLSTLLSLWIFASVVLADFSVQVADPGKKYSAGDNITIQWSWLPGMAEPDDLDLGQFKLCTISSGDLNCGQEGQYLARNVTISDKQEISVSLSSMKDIAENGEFTVQFSANNENITKQTIFYAEQFFAISSGMTGTKAANEGGIPSGSMSGIESSVSWYSYTVPASLSSLLSSSGMASGAFTYGYLMPYTWQKGPTRTAPFQSTPGTKVTMSYTGGRPSNRYPTSSYSPFKTLTSYKYMQVTTVTPGPVSSAIQHVNFATTLATTPSGYKQSRVLPTIAPTTNSASASGSGSGSGGNSRRRRRWLD